MSQADQNRSENAAPAPRGSSFVIGCFIGLACTIAAGVVILIFGIQRAQVRKQQTLTWLRSAHGRLEALKNSGRLPVAKGLGSDFSGQEALQAVGFEFEPGSIKKGLSSDAWGQPFLFRSDGQSYQFYSCGPNGRDDHGEFDDLKAQ